MIFKINLTTGFDVQNQENNIRSVISILNTEKNLSDRTNIKSWLQSVGRCRQCNYGVPVVVYLY